MMRVWSSGCRRCDEEKAETKNLRERKKTGKSLEGSLNIGGECGIRWRKFSSRSNVALNLNSKAMGRSETISILGQIMLLYPFVLGKHSPSSLE